MSSFVLPGAQVPTPILPETLASLLEKAYGEYYEKEKERLIRRQKDVAALKIRAEIPEHTAPEGLEENLASILKQITEG